MKQLSVLLKDSFGNSSTAKRAQLRNEILIRGDEILAEIAKGWSARAIWEVLNDTKEITCSYKTFVGHVRRLQLKASASAAVTPKKEKNFNWNPTPNKEDLV